MIKSKNAGSVEVSIHQQAHNRYSAQISANNQNTNQGMSQFPSSTSIKEMSVTRVNMLKSYQNLTNYAPITSIFPSKTLYILIGKEYSQT